MEEIILIGDKKNEFEIRQEALNNIIEVEKKMKELKKVQNDYKKQLLDEMEEKGILKISNEEKGITITYVEAKEDLEKFNPEKLREDHPDLYDEYVTMDGKKSAYITIRTNG